MKHEYIVEPNMYPDGISVLRLLDEYEESLASSRNIDVQDTFVVNALKALSFDPIENNCLAPRLWNVSRPGLDLRFSVNLKHSLVLTVSPWPEKVSGGIGVGQLTHFAKFPLTDTPIKRQEAELIALPLEELAAELRAPDMEVGPEMTVARKLTFACCEFIVERLSMHFKCRIKAGIFRIGPDAHLVLRSSETRTNDVDQVVDESSLPAMHWHSNFQALCKEVGIRPADLEAFYVATLEKMEPKAQLKTLSEYLGENYDYHTNARHALLLDVIRVLHNPEEFPPLTGHPSAAIERAFKQLSRDSVRRVSAAIADAYKLDEQLIHGLLREQYRTFLDSKLKTAQEFVDEIQHELDHPSAKGGKRLTALRQRLFDELTSAWQASAGGTWMRRLKQLAVLNGFKTIDELQIWSKVRVPEVHQWVSTLQAEYANTPAAKAAAKRAAGRDRGRGA